MAWACVSAGTKKLFSLLSVTSYSSFAFHKVSVTIYNSECWCFAQLRSSFSPTACATRHWFFFFFSLPPVSNAKNIDPGKFPLHYCYCLNNVTNDLTGGYTNEVGNCMRLSWIFSFGAAGCSLNSADFILMIFTTTQRSTSITHDEWLLLTPWPQSQVAAPSQPVWDGAISQVTGVVWLAKGLPFLLGIQIAAQFVFGETTSNMWYSTLVTFSLLR